jgi:microcompartment protein CcmK/EutM
MQALRERRSPVSDSAQFDRLSTATADLDAQFDRLLTATADLERTKAVVVADSSGEDDSDAKVDTNDTKVFAVSGSATRMSTKNTEHEIDECAIPLLADHDDIQIGKAYGTPPS